MRRFSTCTLSLVFLVVGLVPTLTHPSPTYAQTAFAPPLPLPEDPLGQQPEQQLPEITIDVDVRDGHLTARVVDIWGPGRVPLVMRSYTNAQPHHWGISGVGFDPPNNGPFRFQFNHHLDSIGADMLEPDGNRSSFRYSGERWSSDQLHYWQTYVKDVGTYATMELHYNCPPPPPPPPPPDDGCRLCRSPQSGPARSGSKVRPAPRAPRGVRLTNNIEPAPSNCSWDGWHTIFLPKAVVRRFGNGFVVDERDANGNVTTFTYTSFTGGVKPYLTSVTDPLGRVTTYSYEPAYQVCTRTQWSREADTYCVETAWVYRLLSARDPYNRTATYAYDGNSLKITSVTNAAGQITRFTYTPGALLASITNARGFATSFEWITGPDGTPRVTKVFAPDGSFTLYSYFHAPTAPYRVIETHVMNARGHTTRYNLNSGDIVRATNPLANVTEHTYDARHNVAQVTDPRGNRTTFQYNARNKVTQIVQAVGTLNLTTSLAWVSNDNINDNLSSVTNPRGIRTDYVYDSKHNLTSVRRAVGTPDESLTQYTYTSWGGVASVIDPRGNTTTFAYTAERRQLQTVTPPAGGTTTYGYNTLDDPVTMTNGNGRIWTTASNPSRLVTSVTDPLNNVIRHEYDANGNRTRTYDAKNQATTFAYDNRDRLTSITDPLNGVTRYEYDSVSNLMRIINARTHPTTFTYDAANRLTQATDALLQATTYGYDTAGNRTSMRDRKGATHSYAYDEVNRFTQVSAGGLTVSHAYDANGNRTSMTDGNGTTTYTYDPLDRLTRTTTPDGRFVAYAYDRTGNRTRLTYPDGSTTLTYAYDAANRLTQITTGTLTWTLSYDPAGNRTALAQPNGTRTDYAHLTNNWLQAITHKRPDGAAFQSFTYGYDANGNRVSQADGTGNTTFTYDALNRLTAAAYPGTYGSWSWAYDAVGNRTSQTAPSGTTPYTYDANNRLITAGAVNYSYDANGNLTSTTAGQSFSWDAFNRLTGASGSGGSVSYTYNGDGLKLRRTGPDGATVYYHDGIRPIWEADGAGNPRVQLDRDIFGNLLSRREASGVRRYFAHDGLGGLTGITDEAGTHVASLFYDAWGNTRATGGTWTAGNHRFTGAELDSATGLYHMGARFYDPGIGRWLSEDPVDADHQGLNTYAYAALNPISYVDPTGLAACATANCDPRNEAAYVASLTSEPTAAYLAWLGADQAGRTPPSGWERHINAVLAASRTTGVPASLILGIMTVETGGLGYNPSLVGAAGEIGLMQILPSTAAMYGVTRSQLFDANTNILTGARYLADLLRMYESEKDQLAMAASAYNQGPGNLARRGLNANRAYWSSVLAYMNWFRRRFP